MVLWPKTTKRRILCQCGQMENVSKRCLNFGELTQLWTEALFLKPIYPAVLKLGTRDPMKALKVFWRMPKGQSCLNVTFINGFGYLCPLFLLNNALKQFHCSFLTKRPTLKNWLRELQSVIQPCWMWFFVIFIILVKIP